MHSYILDIEVVLSLTLVRQLLSVAFCLLPPAFTAQGGRAVGGRY